MCLWTLLLSKYSCSIQISLSNRVMYLSRYWRLVHWNTYPLLHNQGMILGCLHIFLKFVVLHGMLGWSKAVLDWNRHQLLLLRCWQAAGYTKRTSTLWDCCWFSFARSSKTMFKSRLYIANVKSHSMSVSILLPAWCCYHCNVSEH